MAVTPTTAPEVRARWSVTAAGWEEAIRLAAAPLVDAGAITSHYVDRCVAMVREQGPYMVVAPGIALAHARPRDGALRQCLALATLAAPVRFEHPDNDPVDLVFVFGSPDAGAHVALLARLSEALKNDLVARLRAAASDAALLRLLKEATSGNPDS